ncbi:hypothetical protein ACTHAM_002401 [Cellulomonas soli]|uniref:hypothetical protein n=1 Tax=Cellulomonas soli TaxID=931535 RepID=UPI003F86176B
MSRRHDVHQVLLLVAGGQPLSEVQCDLYLSLTPEDRARAVEDAKGAQRLYREIATDGKLAQMILGQYGIGDDIPFGEAMRKMAPEDAHDIEVLMQDIAANQRITNVLYGTEWSAPVEGWC